MIGAHHLPNLHQLLDGNTMLTVMGRAGKLLSIGMAPGTERTLSDGWADESGAWHSFGREPDHLFRFAYSVTFYAALCDAFNENDPVRFDIAMPNLSHISFDGLVMSTPIDYDAARKPPLCLEATVRQIGAPRLWAPAVGAITGIPELTPRVGADVRIRERIADYEPKPFPSPSRSSASRPVRGSPSGPAAAAPSRPAAEAERRRGASPAPS